MQTVPITLVQILHLSGPLEGEVQEFSEPELRIGRQSDCHIRFPNDLRMVSRSHACILREG
jgi:pSer/pThr/pTyr-binding forkhead associated (FHA) protein